MEEATPQPFDVWPDNWEVACIFAAMDTQWSMGMAGKTGLNYSSLPVVMRIEQIPRSRWRDVFAGVRVMEDAALEFIHRRRK